MSKKSVIARNEKRKNICLEYFSVRKNLITKIKKSKTIEEKMILLEEFEKIPRDSSKTRIRNRCAITGRPRGYFRYFGLCRNAFRDFAHKGFIPGIIKSSW